MSIFKKLYFELLRIRMIELEISKRYKEQKMRCPIHLSVGQEAVPVGVCGNLTKNDKIVTAHRSHAHYLAKGGNLKSMIVSLKPRQNLVINLDQKTHLLQKQLLQKSLMLPTMQRWSIISFISENDHATDKYM